MPFWERNNHNPNIRTIKTARDLNAMNKAVRAGYKVVVRKVKPSSSIKSKYAVIQNKKTGLIEVISDYRRGLPDKENQEYVTLIGWTYYYPYYFKYPFAAYLIPQDIKEGETVYVEDLIEDFVGARWNQGDSYRLKGCEAVWNGNDLEIRYDPKTNMQDFIG